MTIIVDQQQPNVPFLPEPNYAKGGMSFLKMAQRLRQESGTSGANPTSVLNQSGDVKSLVDWISTAWMDIQNERSDWFFMRQPMQFNTIAGKQSYTADDAGIVSFGNFKLDSFRQWLTSDGPDSETYMYYMNYDDFRNSYMLGSLRTAQSSPIAWSVDYSKNFLIGMVPNDVYTINGEGYAMPTELEFDDDRPTLPSQYHMMIVWRALMYYGAKENAPECYTNGQNEYLRLMNKLLKDQLPEIEYGSALA